LIKIPAVLQGGDHDIGTLKTKKASFSCEKEAFFVFHLTCAAA
jgi:hypothetical protein